jgi:two-component system, OmpR family, phosphate regulon response regulator OmpR
MADPQKSSPQPLDDTAPHILVVDDDRRLRDLLRKYLTGNGYRVTTAEDGQDARAKLKGLAFDGIVLDVMMPGETGLDLTRALRDTSDVPILLLTAMGEAEDRITGLERGADDYLPKPFEPRELILRLGAILRRGVRQETVPPPDQRISLGTCCFDVERSELRRGPDTIRLTEREAALLGIFAQNPRVVISRSELAARTGTGQERSIDVQVARLRRKFEEDPKSPRHLKTVRSQGYVLWPD